MKTKYWVSSLLAILLMISVPAQLGCSGGTSNAASDEETNKSSDAEPAKDGDDKKSDDGDDAKGDSKRKKKKGDKDDDEKKEEAVPVEVAALSTGNIESVLRFSANLEAEEEVQVFSEAKRLVRELLVEEGDRVERDQVLLRLQDAEQRSALAKVASQLKKAEREYKRQQRLFNQQLISEQAFNDATYELDQLKISMADAERELGYTEVRAPISGRVTARMISLGDQVQIGQHLFDIVDFNSIVARIFVPERHLALLRRGLEARLTSQAAAGREYNGRVLRISPIVDPKSGTVKVTVNVGWQQGLRPGMYVDVDLVTATSTEAVLVPKRALVYDDDQMFVFRLGDERRVERIFIEPQLMDKQFVEPADGLNPGDQIVVAGQAGLKDGALVRLPGDKKTKDDSANGGSDEQAVTKASL